MKALEHFEDPLYRKVADICPKDEGGRLLTHLEEQARNDKSDVRANDGSSEVGAGSSRCRRFVRSSCCSSSAGWGPRFENALKEGLELTKCRLGDVCCVSSGAVYCCGLSTSSIGCVMRTVTEGEQGVGLWRASVSARSWRCVSCTVLPLFGGIWMRGAWLGPATAFLYSGPAINVLRS